MTKNKEMVIQRVVPFEIAKLLKKMGYDEKISEFYQYSYPLVAKGGVKMGGKYENHFTSHVAYSNTEWETNIGEFSKTLRFDGKHPPISAPSYDMVIDWIYLNYGYFVEVMLVNGGKFRYGIASGAIEQGLRFSNRVGYSTRYEAMNAAFEAVLKLIGEDRKIGFKDQLMDFLKSNKKDGQTEND